MSYGNSGDHRPTKNARRDAAREQSRRLRAKQKRKDRRGKVLLQGGIIVGSLAIVTVIALVLVNSIKPEATGPANMASDGIQIKQGNLALTTPGLAPNQTPVPNPRDTNSKAINITMYVDYLCPICGQFEATNGAYISSLLDKGGATVEVHPIAILDRLSQGTKYSTRATNAAACVADSSPNAFYSFHTALFAKQPAENTVGLTDEQLIAIANGARVENATQVSACIKDQTFKAWATAATARALNGPVPNSNVDKIQGTPTVIVNGLKYEGSVTDLPAFQAFVIQAAGSVFNQNSTATPTPTPTK